MVCVCVCVCVCDSQELNRDLKVEDTFSHLLYDLQLPSLSARKTEVTAHWAGQDCPTGQEKEDLRDMSYRTNQPYKMW